MNPLLKEPMTFEQYMARVMAGVYPENPLVQRAIPFLNPAGSIENVALGQLGGVAVIRSEANAMRSNHYHRTDWHFMVVLEGTMIYFSKKREDPQVTSLELKHGDIVFTAPGIIHATYFPEPTTILAISRLSRTHDQHEADLVREPMIRLDERGVPVFTSTGEEAIPRPRPRPEE